MPVPHHKDHMKYLLNEQFPFFLTHVFVFRRVQVVNLFKYMLCL